MSEFATLLKEAAGQPPRPLDMAQVRQRATTLGLRRRLGVWLAAIIAVAGIGVPVGVGLAPGADRPTGVRTIDGDTHPQPSTGEARTDVGSGESPPSGATGGSQGRAGRRMSPAGTSEGSEPTETTIGGEDPSTPDDPEDDDGCTRAGPVAAECGEADATACWAARVGCATTTTTTTQSRPAD